jgi:uncharacterized membrane protein YccC
MTFFVTQFLHTGPAQLPELYVAVGLSLLVSSAVRFLLWCYERDLPPAVAPAPPGGGGLARTTTRQAIQATAGGAVALVLGQALSEQRWYWAVGATWWIFVNTASRGETLVRGFRRVLGTLIGIAVGLVVVVPLQGAVVPSAVLVAACVFGIFYTAAVSYTWLMLSVTVMAGLLYGLLGVLDPGLLALRLAETGVGVLGAVLAVLFVLPVTTHAATDAWIERSLHAVRDFTAEAARHLTGGPGGASGSTPGSTDGLARRAAELDHLLGRVRVSVAPLVHPLSPMRRRKARARAVLALLDDCAARVRALTEVVADPQACHDARLLAACARVEAAVARLVVPGAAVVRNPEQPASGAAGGPAHADGALAHLHGLEAALTDLAVPLRAASRAALAA